LFTNRAKYGRIFTYGGNKEDSKPSANVKKIFKKDVYIPPKMWYNNNINETLNECVKLKTTVVERHGSQDDALTID
jgi:hypothetical protein